MTTFKVGDWVEPDTLSKYNAINLVNGEDVKFPARVSDVVSNFAYLVEGCKIYIPLDYLRLSPKNFLNKTLEDYL